MSDMNGPRPRRSSRYRILRALLAIVIVLAGAVIFTLATAPGGRLIALVVNRFGSSALTQIEVDNVRGLVSGNTRIGHVLVSDGEGEPWLLLSGVEIDWSPFAVFTAGLAVDRLSVARVELAGLPEGGGEESETDGAFALPLNIDIKDITLPEILVGEAIAGRVARFSAGGALRLDAALSDARAILTAERIDGVGGKATIDATLNLPEEQFDLDAALSEPAGGVLAHMAGLSETEAVAIAAQSTGKLSDWTLRITGEIDGARLAGADISVKAAGEEGLPQSYGFDVLAEGEIARFLPPAVAGLFEGNSSLIAAGTVEPEFAGVTIAVLTLDSASLSAEGQGRIAREGEVDFTANAAATNGAARLSFGEGEGRIDVAVASLQAAMKGNATDATVALSATLPSVESAGYSLEGVTARADFANADLSAGSANGRVAISAESAGAADPIAARALAGAVSLSAAISMDGTTVSTDDLVLSTGTTKLQMTGGFDTSATTAEAVIAGELNSAVLSPGLPATIGPTVRLSASATLAGDGAVVVDDLVVASDRLRATGGLTLDADRQVAATLAATLADLATVNPNASGSVSLAAEVSGPIAAPELDATLTGTGIVVAGEALEDLELTAKAVLDPARPTADVALSGQFRGKPVTGSAKLAQRDGVNEINPLSLAIEDNRVDGALTLDADFLPTGTIRLDMPDIAALAALALQELSGSGAGNLVFKVTDGVPSLAADVALQSLSGSGFSLSDASVKATVSDYVAAPGIAGSASVKALVAGGTRVSDIALGFAQVDGWTEIDGKANADGIPATVKGKLRQADGATEIELSAARLSYRGLPITLSAPAKVSVRDGVATIGSLAVSPGGGTVTVTGTAGSALALDVRLASVPLTVVEAFAPGTGLKGAVSGTVKVTGTGSAPAVRYDLRASGVGAAALAAVSAPPLAVSVNGTYGGDTVDFSATAADGSGLKLDASGRVGLSGARALSIRANGSAPFGLVASRLAAQGLVLNGAALINMSIGGTVASPDFSGSITTSSARFVDTNSGIAITDIAADIGLNRQSVQLRSLSGNLAGGGTLSGSGTVGLDGAAGYPGDLSIKVARGRYADGKLVATRFDADLTIKGPLANVPVLGGVLTLDQTTVTVPSTLPGSIAKLGVTHENAGGAVNAQAARLEERAGSGTGGGLGLDLRIDAPNRIFVRGRGIDAEFAGSLTLRGTTGSPVASGGFDLVRGRLDVLGKRLTFDRGRIGFAGSMIPTLDFAASTRSGSTTATILVTGLATAPEFSFTSSPSLPEDEVLAQLIFGRSLSNLSPLQIAQLASAAAELTGVTSGGGIVDKLRRATGIDDLDVRTDEETGETSVGVGKYLNDRTYIGIEQGQSAGSGKARIDLNIGGGLKLRGEATSGGETKGGLFFERDY